MRSYLLELITSELNNAGETFNRYDGDVNNHDDSLLKFLHQINYQQVFQLYLLMFESKVEMYSDLTASIEFSLQKPNSDLVDVYLAYFVFDIIDFSSKDDFNITLCVSLSTLWKKCLLAFPNNGRLLTNLGSCLIHLSNCKVDSRKNLAEAVLIYGKALLHLEELTPIWASSNLRIALILEKLARLGVDSIKNLESGIRYCNNALEFYSEHTADWAKCILFKTRCLEELAVLGVNSRQNLIESLLLHDKMRSYYEGLTPDWVSCILRIASVCQKLAELGVDPLTNLKNALHVCDIALLSVEEQTPDWADCLRVKATALNDLAFLGVNANENVKEAVTLYDTALQYFEEQSPSWYDCLRFKAATLRQLADLGVDSRNNLEEAVTCLDKCIHHYEEQTPAWADCLRHKATALSQLALLGFNAISNLESALMLYETALEYFEEHTPNWAYCISGKATVLQQFADLGVASRNNLEAAIQTYDKALAYYGEQTPDGAQCLFGKVSALLQLHPLVGARQNFDDVASLVSSLPASIFPSGSILWLILQKFQIFLAPSASRKLQLSKEAIEILERERNRIRNAKEKSEFIERASELYLLRFQVLIESNQHEEAWHTLHLCKNRTVIEAALNFLPPPKNNPGLEKLYSEIKKLDEQLLDQETMDKVAEGLINDLRKQKSSIVGQYLDLHPEKVPSLQDTFTSFAALGSNSVLIELVPTDGGTYVFCYNPGTHTHDTLPNFEPLLIPEATESWVRQVIQHIEDINNNISEIKDRCNQDADCREQLHTGYGNELKDYLSALGTVWSTIFDKFSLADEIIHTIVVTGHGEYSLLPHACAFWNDSYLIERKQVVILPTPCISKNIKANISDISTTAGWAVNAANLSAANEEANDSAKIWARSGIAKIIPDCKKEEVLNLSNGKYVLHLIGHANFALYDPQQSAFHCSDYKLYPSDISSSMNLDSCNLVVLSACSAGAHAPRRGDSFAGLAHAFYDAGAPSIIAPLWFVYDETAKDFSTAFYKNWVDKSVSLASAYQSAMKNLIGKYSDFPQFWMAWQLIGAWETTAVSPTPSN
jgi:tetratricopeptide (TPR) repeat protein